MEPHSLILAAPSIRKPQGASRTPSEQSYLCCLQLQRGTLSMAIASGHSLALSLPSCVTLGHDTKLRNGEKAPRFFLPQS